MAGEFLPRDRKHSVVLAAPGNVSVALYEEVVKFASTSNRNRWLTRTGPKRHEILDRGQHGLGHLQCHRQTIIAGP